MGSASAKQLRDLYESNSLRMTLPCFEWKIFGFTKNNRLREAIISLLSHYHIIYLNTGPQYFIVIQVYLDNRKTSGKFDPSVESPYLLTLLF